MVLAQVKRISKRREAKIIDGVCGGFADYVGVEAVWVRIAWAILVLAGGMGLVAYLLGMYFFPRAEPRTAVPQETVRRSKGTLAVGLILLAVGVTIILRAIGILDYGFWGAWHVAWVVLWPLSLIGGGLFLLFIYWRQGTEGKRVFKRPVWDKMVLGVCSGLGRFLKVDPNLVRFAFALLIILSRGVGLIVYLAVGLITPETTEDMAEPPGEE